mgnify:FL=1
MSFGLSLYIATNYGSDVPYALLNTVRQKSDGSLVASEVWDFPISIPSIPITYRSLILSGGLQITLPSSSLFSGRVHRGCSSIFILPFGFGIHLNPSRFYSIWAPSLYLYSRNPVSIGGHFFNALIFVSYSAMLTLLNLLSPSKEKASSAL